MVDVREFYNELVTCGVDAFFGVPDSLLKDFCACASDLSPEGRFVIAANEGNAVGMACGWHLATKRSACVYMQNSGEGNAINPLLSLADPDVYSIPMLLIIGWRGEPGIPDEPQHAKQGKVTTSLLEAMDVPYEILSEETWANQVHALLSMMRSASRPVALVVKKGSFSPWPFKIEKNSRTMTREQAVEAILGRLEKGDLVVSTTGKESREVFEVREARSQSHEADFLTVGGMGHTLSIAWGMALGAPQATVWCLDGDGSMLMHMGSLAVAAQHPQSNLKYIVNVNGAHESVGGQPNVAADIDVARMLRTLGFQRVIEADSPEAVAAGIDNIRPSGLSAMVVHTRQGSRDNLGRPTIAPRENKEAMMCFICAIEKDAR